MHLKETLPQFIRSALAEPRDAAVVERVGGSWTPTSSRRLLERVEAAACGIRALGLQSGDCVALIANDSVDWIVADLAILFAGCVVVPVFPTSALDQMAYILDHSRAALVFVDTPAAVARLRKIGDALPPIVVFESSGENSLGGLETRGGAIKVAHPDLPREYQSAQEPDDLAVLIYTSGTTGVPKGVMLSHHNIVFTVHAAFEYAFTSIHKGDPVLSVLPFSHIYEHMVLYGYMMIGVRHYVSHGAEQLLGDLRDVRPLMMTSVPRILERVIALITARSQESGLQARLVPWALDVGRRYMTAKVRNRNIPLGLRLQYRIAHALVLRKLRHLLGLDRVKFLVSGSATLHFDTAMTYLAADIPIIEGYGPTECSPVIAVNRLEDNRYGTVGKPMPGVDVKLSDDGEVSARGTNVMLGYYREPEATADAIEDGWYKTGDVGEMDADGYLRITDRKKELFKTSGGKFIAPARIESAIKRSIYVAQAMVVGNSRPYPIALVSPDWQLVSRKLGLPAKCTTQELAQRDDVHSFLVREVRANSADLANFERVRRVIVMPADFSIETGELSPTLKVRRRVVEERYAEEIERAYRTS